MPCDLEVYSICNHCASWTDESMIISVLTWSIWYDIRELYVLALIILVSVLLSPQAVKRWSSSLDGSVAVR